VDEIRGQKAHCREIEMLEDLQLLEQNKTGRIGRRFEHGEAAIVDRDGLLGFGDKAGKIGRRHQRPDRSQTRRQPPCQAPAVEGLGAFRGDFFERIGEGGLHDRGADRRCLAIDQKARCAGWIDSQGGAVFAGEMPVVRGGGKAVAGKGDGLDEEIAPRQPAKALVHRRDPGEHAWD